MVHNEWLGEVWNSLAYFYDDAILWFYYENFYWNGYFLILDVLFPDKSKNSEQSSNQIMPPSSTSKPKSVSVIENGQEKKVCPECNAKVSPDANWCPQCGHQFKK